MAESSDSILSENAFYRNYYQSFLIGILAAIFLLLIMVIVVMYLVQNRPLPLFQAIAPSGKKMSLTSFPEPNYLPDTLLTWSSKAAVAAYTFDFVNYRKQIDNASIFFTTEGSADYRDSVAGLIDQIVARQIFVNAVVSGTPVIYRQGPLPGHGYAWRVQLPLLVTYQSAEDIERDNYYVTLTIVKVPTNVDPRGIGINQFVMRAQ